jgi:cell division septum initiation protein DivIVA
VGDGEAPQESLEAVKRVPTSEEGSAADVARVPAAIRDVSFPTAGRGYERRAVDSYVSQVNRLIAELEVGRSPQAAVRHALERVEDQTKGLLEQARETAEKMTNSAREEADQEVARARGEAEEILAGAHTAQARADEIVAKAKADASDALAAAKVRLSATGERRRAVKPTAALPVGSA